MSADPTARPHRRSPADHPRPRSETDRNTPHAPDGPRARKLLDTEAGVFRANPDLQLVILDSIASPGREALLSMQGAEPIYGVLQRRDGSQAPPIIVSNDTALLYLTLAEPSRLPASLCRRFGPRWQTVIERLVLDGVLQIQTPDGFVHGPAALAHAAPLHDTPDAAGAIFKLSLAAIRYAADLALDDPVALSSRMYCYNRIPATAEWRQRFNAPDAAARAWGFDGERSRKRLRRWTESPAPAPDQSWCSWRPRATDTPALRHDRTTYKLYVSPLPGALQETFAATVDALSAGRATSFKAGRDVHGILRPDKLVAYFDTLQDLQHTAERLQARLAGIPAQGVPFTADISGDGLLSWGTDPPRSTAPTPSLFEESWRYWVTNRLALAITAARRQHDHQVEPWRFALERLALEGVDPQTWAPAQQIWRDTPP